MNTLIEKARQWGVDKGLTGPNGSATIEAQFEKFLEEVDELFTALADYNRKEVRDALGDLQVVAIQAESIVNGLESVMMGETENGNRNIHRRICYAISNLMDSPDNSFEEIRELSWYLGHDPDECLQEAYDVISKRTGSMVNGVFVKDGKGEQ